MTELEIQRELDQATDNNSHSQVEQDHSPTEQVAGSNSACASKRKAHKPNSVEVLYALMLSHRKLAEENITACVELLRKAQTGFDATSVIHPDLVKAVDHFISYNKYALLFVEAARYLIDFQSPRLSQTDINRSNLTRYIVEVPRRPRDQKEWLDKVEFDQTVGKFAQEQAEFNRQVPLSDILPDDVETVKSVHVKNRYVEDVEEDGDLSDIEAIEFSSDDDNQEFAPLSIEDMRKREEAARRQYARQQHDFQINRRGASNIDVVVRG